MLFIRDNIPFRLLKPGILPSNTEALFIEINLRKKKWLMCCGCNPNKSLINKFTHDIGKVLNSCIGNYDNFLTETLKLLKAQWMISAIVIICTVYVINLPVIKFRKKHHTFIFFLQILLRHSKTVKQ